MSALGDVERRIMQACADRSPCRESMAGRYGERVPCVLLGKHEWHGAGSGVFWNGSYFMYSLPRS